MLSSRKYTSHWNEKLMHGVLGKAILLVLCLVVLPYLSSQWKFLSLVKYLKGTKIRQNHLSHKLFGIAIFITPRPIWNLWVSRASQCSAHRKHLLSVCLMNRWQWILLNTCPPVLQCEKECDEASMVESGRKDWLNLYSCSIPRLSFSAPLMLVSCSLHPEVPWVPMHPETERGGETRHNSHPCLPIVSLTTQLYQRKELKLIIKMSLGDYPWI